MTSGHFWPEDVTIPFTKAESINMNKPSGDQMELEKLSQISFYPRAALKIL